MVEQRRAPRAVEQDSGGGWPADAKRRSPECRSSVHDRRRRHLVLADVAQQTPQHLAGRRVVERVGPEGVAQLAHQRGRADPAARHVAHGQVHEPIVAMHDVVPVAADLEAGAAGVVAAASRGRRWRGSRSGSRLRWSRTSRRGPAPARACAGSRRAAWSACAATSASSASSSDRSSANSSTQRADAVAVAGGEGRRVERAHGAGERRLDGGAAARIPASSRSERTVGGEGELGRLGDGEAACARGRSRSPAVGGDAHAEAVVGGQRDDRERSGERGLERLGERPRDVVHGGGRRQHTGQLRCCWTGSPALGLTARAPDGADDQEQDQQATPTISASASTRLRRAAASTVDRGWSIATVHCGTAETAYATTWSGSPASPWVVADHAAGRAAFRTLVEQRRVAAPSEAGQDRLPLRSNTARPL